MNETGITQIFTGLSQSVLLRILLIVAGAWLLSALIERMMRWLAKRMTARLRLSILSSIPVMRLIVFIIAALWIAPLVITPTFENVVAIVGALGLAIGFAFKDYVNSILAGIVAIYEQPYRVGDWIQVDDAYGEVRAMGLRALRLVTLDDTVVTIPHTKLWNTNIYNANDGQHDLLCVTDFYLNPRHDAAQVREKLHDVALSSPYLQIQRPVTIIVKEQPWGTHYRLKAYPIDGRDQSKFTTDLTVRGKAALEQIGVKPAHIPPVVAAGSK